MDIRTEDRIVRTELIPSLSRNAARPQPPAEIEQPAIPSLLDLLVTLAERKRLILTMAAAGTAIMVAAAFLVAPTFTATAVIVPPQQQQAATSALLGQLGSIAGIAGTTLGVKNPADLYVGILGGRTIADNLIAEFHLRQVYETRTDTQTRKALANRSTFSTGKDALIKISVEDHDPARAAAITNAYVDELQKQNSQLALTESGQRRLFFERELNAEKLALAGAEDTYAKTEQRTGMIDLTGQAQLAVRSAAEVQAEIAGREVILQSLKTGATDQNPDVVRQREELRALREQLARLESNQERRRPGNPLLPTSRLPEVGLENIRRLRDLKYHETLFELLSKQYEIARIDEAKESPVIQIVDPAVAPDQKSWPPRAMLTALGGVGFGLLGCVIAIMGRRFDDPVEAEKMARLKAFLFGRRRQNSK